MRWLPGISLLLLGCVAALAAFIALSSVPSALSEFSTEPEDLYGAVFWAVVAVGLALYWLRTGSWLLLHPYLPLRRPMRIAAVFVAGVGVACIVWAVVDPLDRELAATMAAFCLASSVPLLRRPATDVAR